MYNIFKMVTGLILFWF